jgi:hypothetical protein
LAYAVLNDAAQGSFSCLQIGALLPRSLYQRSGISPARTVDNQIALEGGRLDF